MDLECVKLSEVTQSQKEKKLHVLPCAEPSQSYMSICQQMHVRVQYM